MSQQMPTHKELETEAEKSELYLQAQKLKPKFGNHLEAIAAIQSELEKLAFSAGLTVNLFLQKAESSNIFDETYLKALALKSQLGYCKSQNK